MSDHVVHEVRFTGGAPLTSLSEDFRRVVERIQSELNGVALHPMDLEHLATADAAERAVDDLALELQRDVGNRSAWQGALVDYESAWLEIIRNARGGGN